MLGTLVQVAPPLVEDSQYWTVPVKVPATSVMKPEPETPQKDAAPEVVPPTDCALEFIPEKQASNKRRYFTRERNIKVYSFILNFPKILSFFLKTELIKF